jgi:plasmid maintenance system antidote protein VapI
MGEVLESVVQELNVLMDEIVEKMAKVSKIANEMYFLRGLINEVYGKVKVARDMAKKVERMVGEGRYVRG